MRMRPAAGIAVALASLVAPVAPGHASAARGAAPAGPATGPVTAFFDVAYEVVGLRTFTLDVYEPGDGLTHPGMLLVHGGAWTKGDKSLWVEEGRALAEDGFVAFAANFRLSPPGGASHAPDPVLDLEAAMSWIRANAASYGVDPLAVGALGDSSGGNLALMLATTGSAGGSKADAVVAWSAPTDLPARPGSSSSETYVGCTYASCPDAWVAASPIDQVDSSDAPTYLANSTKEHTPLSQATSMADALAAAGVPEQLRVIKGRLHARAYEAKVWSQSLAFLHQHLDGATPAASRITHGTRVLSSPVVRGGIVYVGAEDGSLHAFDAVAGGPLWSTAPGGIVDSAPALADGRVYAGSQDGSVRAFDAVTGAPVWQTAAALGSFADVSPVADGGRMLAASEDGALQALDEGTGGSVWTTGPGAGVVARIQFRPAVSGGLVVTGSNRGRLPRSMSRRAARCGLGRHPEPCSCGARRSPAQSSMSRR